MDKIEEIELITSNEEYDYKRLLQLSYDNDAEVRMRAIEALYPFSDIQQVVDRVREIIRDPDELVRVEGLDILGEWEDTSSVSKIINCLNDEQWLVKGYAAIALGKIGDKNAIKAIEERLSDTSNDEELLRYCMALWCLGNEQYKEKVLDYLEHPYYRVRCAVANLLEDCKDYVDLDQGIVKKLEDALKKEETEAAYSSISDAIRNINFEKSDTY